MDIMEFYRKSKDEIMHEFQSGIEGLTGIQVENMRIKFGSNELQERQKKSPFIVFLLQFNDFLIWILLVAAVLSGVLGKLESTLVIAIVVLINAILGTVQHLKAEESLSALKALSAPRSKVIRNGEIVTVDSKDVVVGDLMLVETGDFISADGRIIDSFSLRADESSLTGESVSVEKDTLLLRTQDYVKPFSKKFGIGNYFEPDFKFEGSEDDLANLVIEAQKKAEQDQKQEEADREEARAVRAAKIEEGKKLVSVPQWAKTVIVADFYQDDSDSMTDYFSTSIGTTIYLAFSKSDRNNMTELHKAKLLFEDTKDLEDEHTDQHSYLPDYFIGSSRWSGWKVNKRKYFDLTKTETLERLYIAAAEGRYLIGEATPEAEPVRIEGLNVFIVDYSEKAVAMFGDTKEIKDQLKSLGGRFNKFLTHNGEKKPGWIFKKEQREELEKLV